MICYEHKFRNKVNILKKSKTRINNKKQTLCIFHIFEKINNYQVILKNEKKIEKYHTYAK